MKLVYDVNDTPKFKANVIFALQQLLAIIAATLLVPVLVNLNSNTELLSQAAALFGAGAGTLVYVLFTRKKSPVFLGSSFAFISPLVGATAFGYFGIILGAIYAGLVYVIIAVIIHFIGTKWVDRFLPAVVIGPTVALIGLSLCGSAINNLNNTAGGGSYNLVAILCGVIAFFCTVFSSVKGGRVLKLIPFIIGIGAGYAVAAIFTIIGTCCNCDYLKILDISPLVNNFSTITLASFFQIPLFTFAGWFKDGFAPLNGGIGAVQILVLFAPVAFVVFAEHIADHKNLSSVIEKDLIKDPGLTRTLLGDGVGSIVGSFFGGCPNTTYGESIGCVAITGNASVSTITLTAIFSILLSFFSPFVALVNTIPICVIGGICIALYGFIAVSGLKMLQTVDLNDSRNLFVVSAVLVPGIGGLTLNFGGLTLTSIATALILGIVLNICLPSKKE